MIQWETDIIFEIRLLHMLKGCKSGEFQLPLVGFWCEVVT